MWSQRGTFPPLYHHYLPSLAFFAILCRTITAHKNLFVCLLDPSEPCSTEHPREAGRYLPIPQPQDTLRIHASRKSALLFSRELADMHRPTPFLSFFLFSFSPAARGATPDQSVRVDYFSPDPCTFPHFSTASNAFSTSSATPPGCVANLMTRATSPRLTPPRGGVHTPGVCKPSRKAIASALDVGATPPVALFKALGTPGGVRREGGSMVRMARRRSEEAEEGAVSPTERASTASATASSSLLGSKMMLAPMATTRRVMGGREEVARR